MEQHQNESSAARRRGPADGRRAAATPAYYLYRPASVWLAALAGRSPALRRRPVDNAAHDPTRS